MKESYREGVASHPGPQPCEGGREAALEAPAGADSRCLESAFPKELLFCLKTPMHTIQGMV
jgi:hypothetical protein